MEKRFKVLVPPGAIIHEGDDIASAAAAFYTRMEDNRSRVVNQSILLFEDGVLVSAFNGNDFIKAD